MYLIVQPGRFKFVIRSLAVDLDSLTIPFLFTPVDSLILPVFKLQQTTVTSTSFWFIGSCWPFLCLFVKCCFHVSVTVF